MKPLAGIGQRFTAQFVDGIVAVAAGVFCYLVADALGLSLKLALAGFLLYLLLCDGFPGGQSVGKRLSGISVVHTTTEEPCSYGQSCIRNMTRLLGVIDAAFIIGGQRRRLGDYLGRTKVIQQEPIQ